MKKLLFLLFLIINYAGFAQSTFGFKAGLNVCKFTGPGVINGASELVAWNVGIYSNIPVAKTTNLQIELFLSWKGEKYNGLVNNLQSSGSFKFTYLNLPVLIRQKIVSGLYAETGPQLGLLINATQTNNGSSSDYTNLVTSLDFGWDFGIGYSFSKMLSLGARYNLGISDLAASGTTGGAYRNSVLSINIYFSPVGRHAK